MRDTVPVATPLDAAQRTALQSRHPAWTIEGDSARRSFRFDDFGSAVAFVIRVAIAAERADHHPDIDLRWNLVTLALTTHSSSALTDRDAALIAEIDEWGMP